MAPRPEIADFYKNHVIGPRLKCPRLKEKIWVICIYQGIAEIPVAWAMTRLQVQTFPSRYIYFNDSEEIEV